MSRSQCPKLRWPLNIEHIASQGRELSVIRDPLGLCSEPIVLERIALPILARFDGKHSIEAIAAEGVSVGLTTEIVEQLAEQLDSFFLLESERSAAKEQQLLTDYRKAESRPAAHAGLVYGNSSESLAAELEDYLSRASAYRLSTEEASQLISVMSPHIDYRRGWKTYGGVYNALQDVPAPTTVILLGTSHQPGKHLFQLTDKSFDTPLGRFKVAEQALELLGKRCGRDFLFQDELLHLQEHSLELQLPFLAHLYTGQLPKIVPILIGSFHEFIVKGAQPTAIPVVADFVAALAEAIKQLQQAGERVMLIASVDLSHVGQFFGDAERVSDAGLQLIEARDRLLLETLVRADEAALFEHIAEDADARRVCGYPSLYTMFAAKKQAGMRLGGRLLEYRQAVTSENDCIVSFAGATWHQLGA